MSAAPKADAILDTPLRARSLIEASAGTGKTYALAALFARAVIVERLRVAQILAVTYTVAATQELHERVRLRLQQAATLARQWRDGDPAEVESDSAEAALLRRLIHVVLEDGCESPTALRVRLQRAAREMDLAAITTIHGFCQRVLAEHALEAAQPLLAAGLVPGNAAQRSALAVALWRGRSDDAAEADFLQRGFGDIDGLANALRDLLAPEPLLPAAPAGDACAARDDAWTALQAEFAASGVRLREEFNGAMRQDFRTIDRARYVGGSGEVREDLAERGESPENEGRYREERGRADEDQPERDGGGARWSTFGERPWDIH